MFEAGDGKGGYMEALIVEQDKGDAITVVDGAGTLGGWSRIRMVAANHRGRVVGACESRPAGGVIAGLVLCKGGGYDGLALDRILEEIVSIDPRGCTRLRSSWERRGLSGAVEGGVTCESRYTGSGKE